MSPTDNALRKFFPRIESERRHSRLAGWALVLALLAFWEIVTRTGLVSTPDLPPLSDVLASWRDLFLGGNGAIILSITLARAAIGYAIAIVVGVALGVAMGSSALADSLLEPFVELLRPLPVTSLIPLVILFLGIDNELKVFIAFAGALFPILVNTYAGTRSVSSTLRQTAMTFRLTPFQRIWQIVLPSAAPSIFVGLRLGLTIAFIVTVVTEMIAGNSGMGYFILHSEEMMEMPQLYAGILTLAVAGYASNLLFTQIERRVLFWSERVRENHRPSRRSSRRRRPGVLPERA